MFNETGGIGGETTMESEIIKKSTIISSAIIGALLSTAIVVIYILYRKLCKPNSNHDERMENGKGIEYFDQFRVDESQATIYSKTAIQTNVCEDKLSDDFKPSDSPKEVKHITVGKHVFTVSNVSEGKKQERRIFLELPDGISQLDSLGRGDRPKYRLALIDRHARTVHSIDMRPKRTRRLSLSNEVPLSSSPVRSSKRYAVQRPRACSVCECNASATASATSSDGASQADVKSAPYSLDQQLNSMIVLGHTMKIDDHVSPFQLAIPAH